VEQALRRPLELGTITVTAAATPRVASFMTTAE
jgi:hypothetical protein